MALSPFYGWSEPDNSSLVKNGAADIRTLGDAIDTSVWNVGFGQAGKNKIINGDFGIWQRGTSFTNPVTTSYVADRWRVSNATEPTSRTIAQQTFTPGTAPVAGYESAYFLRSTLTTVGSSTAVRVQQRIEDVRTFAGQTATLSFYAKSDSNRTQSVSVTQNFGSGGSTSVTALASTNYSTTTSWTRFTFTFSAPSISGKTIGTSSFLDLSMTQALTDGSVLDLWGVQIEYGSKATPFQTATGTIQGELAACQRYYVRFSGGTVYENFGAGFAASTTIAQCIVNLPVTQRIASAVVDFSTLSLFDGVTFTAVTAMAFSAQSKNQPRLEATVASGLTQYRPYALLVNNSSAAFIGFNAEL
jgi:hypothetical protein